jgi:hypothetical protein
MCGLLKLTFNVIFLANAGCLLSNINIIVSNKIEKNEIGWACGAYG